jgi:hypothetical protein
MTDSPRVVGCGEPVVEQHRAALGTVSTDEEVFQR